MLLPNVNAQCSSTSTCCTIHVMVSVKTQSISINIFFRLLGSGEVIMETETKPKGAEPLGGDAGKEDTEAHTDAGHATTQDSSISNGDDADGQQEMVDLKIIWNKNKYDLKIPIDNTGAKLKESIHSLTGKVARLKTDVAFKGILHGLKIINAPLVPPRSSTGHAESDVQRTAS